MNNFDQWMVDNRLAKTIKTDFGYNELVVTDPKRLSVLLERRNKEMWAKSMDKERLDSLVKE